MKQDIYKPEGDSGITLHWQAWVDHEFCSGFYHQGQHGTLVMFYTGFGTYAHRWADAQTPESIGRMEFDYLMKKLTSYNHIVFDVEATREAGLKAIDEWAEDDGDVEPEKLEEYKDNFNRVCNDCNDIEALYFHLMWEADLVGDGLPFAESECIPVRKVDSPQCRGFFERMLPPILEQWKAQYQKATQEPIKCRPCGAEHHGTCPVLNPDCPFTPKEHRHE